MTCPIWKREMVYFFHLHCNSMAFCLFWRLYQSTQLLSLCFSLSFPLSNRINAIILWIPQDFFGDKSNKEKRSCWDVTWVFIAWSLPASYDSNHVSFIKLKHIMFSRSPTNRLGKAVIFVKHETFLITCVNWKQLEC